MNFMEKFNLKQCAHIGDAVWELFIREKVIRFALNWKEIHNNTVKFVNANFQSGLIEFLKPYLKENEEELVKRGRNLPLNVNKRNNQDIHRMATAFEVLIGYLYLNDKKRLDEIFEIIEKNAL